jgi:hypothetical protein
MTNLVKEKTKKPEAVETIITSSQKQESDLNPRRGGRGVREGPWELTEVLQ